MAKILVTGSDGQLGSELKAIGKESENEFIFTDLHSLDISNEQMVQKFIHDYKPNYLINCAAYTAVDKAEEDIDLARKINGTAPGYIAEACLENNTKLIHISTDYVFDGAASNPYGEEKFTIPSGMYGKTKLEGEEFIVETDGEYIILRTSWLYSTYGNNFVKTMLKLGAQRSELGVVYDQVGTPTYARDLALAIIQIINQVENGKSKFETGIFHYSNEGVASWYDFAHAIFELKNIECKLRALRTEDYPKPAQRPPYSLLAKEKIKHVYGIQIPYWRDSLQVALQAMQNKL